MSRRLQIADNFSLPDDAVTQTFAILAKRGVGKTYTASVMAEEMLKAGHQIIAIDPTGAWWGLRSAFPIVVMGGDHGDLPLEEHAGELIATAIVENGFSAVLDLSIFRKGQLIRFMVAFAETLYRLNRHSVHLFVDEADAVAPQGRTYGGDENRMLGAMEDIVRRGRKRGIGSTLITQRPAVLNKNVLTQCEVLFAMRMVHPADIKAVMEWVNVHAEPNQAKEMIESLPTLAIGEGWIWSPGWLAVFKNISIRRRETFDSSATPKPGQKQTAPKHMAKVDLDALGEQIKSSAQRAKENDPKELKKQINKLKSEMASLPFGGLATKTVEKKVVVEKEVFRKLDVQKAMQLVARAETLSEKMITVTEGLRNQANLLAKELAKVNPVETLDELKKRYPAEEADGERALRCAKTGGHGHQRSGPMAPYKPPKYDTSVPEANGERDLYQGERKILQTLASRYPAKLTVSQLGVLSRFAITGGTFKTYFGVLKKRGLVKHHGHEVELTEAGINYAGVDVKQSPQSTEEVLAMWRSSLYKGEAALLDDLVARYPDVTTKEELAQRNDMTHTGGTFKTYLGTLKRNGLVEVNGDMVQASDSLFR